MDTIRTNRPPRPSHPIQVHPIQYAGKSVKNKLKDLRVATLGKSIIISSLDEIAWLFNLRGSDIHCCPVFFSYAVVTKDAALLYIQSPVSITNEVKTHLEESGVQIKDYDQILTDLSQQQQGEFIVNSNTTNMSLFKALEKNVKQKHNMNHIKLSYLFFLV